MRIPENKEKLLPDGFTIFEVLVATGIVSIALAIIFQSFSLGAVATARSQKFTLAILSAESLMDRIGNDIPLQDGEISGTTNLGFVWRALISPRSLQPAPAKTATLHDIAVDVSWRENGIRRSVDLMTTKIRFNK